MERRGLLDSYYCYIHPFPKTAGWRGYRNCLKELKKKKPLGSRHLHHLESIQPTSDVVSFLHVSFLSFFLFIQRFQVDQNQKGTDSKTLDRSQMGKRKSERRKLNHALHSTEGFRAKQPRIEEREV